MKSACTLCALVFISAAFLAAPAVAQDKKGMVPPKGSEAKAAPDKKAVEKGGEDRKVIVDNDKVLVTQNTYKPGASSAMRERGVRVSRALTEGTLEKTLADGKKETVKWKAGEVKYQPKETFTLKNVGKTDWVVYTVTLK
jgi:hypothetical protein